MVKLMAQYIDKSALVAEIERRMKLRQDGYRKYNDVNDFVAFEELEYLHDEFLPTLEVKEMDFDDFGFYWGEYVSNLGGDINNYEVAKYFYELGIKAQKGE